MAKYNPNNPQTYNLFNTQSPLLSNNLYGGNQVNLGYGNDRSGLANRMFDTASGGGGNLEQSMFGGRPSSPNLDGMPSMADITKADPGLPRARQKATLGDGFTMEGVQERFNNIVRGMNPMYDPKGIHDVMGEGAGIMGLQSSGQTSDEQYQNFQKDFGGTEPPGAEAPKPSMLGMLPGVGNAISLFNGLKNGPEQTTLERAEFDTVDYNPIIAANNAQINRGVNTNNYNIRNNARSAGQLLGGMGANNLRGSQLTGENTAKLGAMQRNTNVGIMNQENQINTSIANQEAQINDQNKAMHRNQMINDVIGIGTSIAGYGADKAMMNSDFVKNQNFLGSMQYLSPMFRAMFDGMNLNMGTKYQKEGR